jgi:hypothetical protein
VKIWPQYLDESESVREGGGEGGRDRDEDVGEKSHLENREQERDE